MAAPSHADLTAARAVALPVQAPYDWSSLIAFLQRRAIDGVEAVEEGSYTRTLRLERDGKAYLGWLRVWPDVSGERLWVSHSASLRAVRRDVLSRVAFLFDTDCDVAAVARALGELAAARPGLRVPGAVDGFELAVRAILGQQITVSAARTLAGRFASAFGEPCRAPGLRAVFPRARDVAGLSVGDVASLGVIAARARAIIEIAQALAAGGLRLEREESAAAAVAQLLSIRGVGEWTAQYIALRALGWRDAFPHGDLALRKALGDVSSRQARELGERWRPFRAYAAMHLWRTQS